MPTKSLQPFKLQFPLSEIPALAQRYMLSGEGEKDVAAMTAAQTARQRGFLTKSEFKVIAGWKSQRPKQRHESNEEIRIAELTGQAFSCESSTEAIVVLTELEGVSVRTATALLHLCWRTPVPIMDIRAFQSLGIIANRWEELHWLRHWLSYCDECRRISSEAMTDLRTLDRALWQFDFENYPPKR